MALYEGLRAPAERPAAPAARPTLRPLPPPRAEAPARAWKELHHERSSSRPNGSFLDDLLGQGSQAKVSRALGTQRIVLPPPGGEGTRGPVLRGPLGGGGRSVRVEALGSGQRPVPAGKKGLGRAALAVIILAFGLVRLHPIARLQGALSAERETPAPSPVVASAKTAGWSQDLASLFHSSSDEDRAKEAVEKEEEARAKDAQESSRLAALPVDPAGGDALALWQDGSGKWWQVNGKAELRPCSGPAGKDSLGLPELRGVSAQAAEHGSGKRLSLKLPEGLLKALLPLEPSVASEVRAVVLDDPAQPALLTHDGTRCLLDPNDWERRQRRLGLVLADLAAKKRRAAVIDLRYEDTAVVRPAGRV